MVQFGNDNEFYGLSLKTINSLMSHGINSIDSLSKYSGKELLQKVRNFGPKKLQEVQNFLAHRDIHLMQPRPKFRKLDRFCPYCRQTVTDKRKKKMENNN